MDCILSLHQSASTLWGTIEAAAWVYESAWQQTNRERQRQPVKGGETIDLSCESGAFWTEAAWQTQEAVLMFAGINSLSYKPKGCRDLFLGCIPPLVLFTFLPIYYDLLCNVPWHTIRYRSLSDFSHHITPKLKEHISARWAKCDCMDSPVSCCRTTQNTIVLSCLLWKSKLIGIKYFLKVICVTEGARFGPRSTGVLK